MKWTKCVAALIAVTAFPAFAHVQQDRSYVPSIPKPSEEDIVLGRDIAVAVLNVNERARITSQALNSTMEQLKTNIISTLTTPEERKNNPAVEAAVHNFLRTELIGSQGDLRPMMPELVDAYAKVYARIFSRDDLVQIKTFVSSRTGTKFLLLNTHIGSEDDVDAWYRQLRKMREARQDTAVEKLKADIATARQSRPSQK